MAFWICDTDENTYKSSAQLKEHFNDYCDWCWGHGFGSCDKCRKYYHHLLYLVKMREFKQSIAAQECVKGE